MDSATMLQTVTETLRSNQNSWSWLSGLTDAQMERLASAVANDIARETRSSNRRLARFGIPATELSSAHVAAFACNLSRGHASLMFG